MNNSDEMLLVKKLLFFIILAGLSLEVGMVKAQLAAGHDKFLGCILKSIGDEGITDDPQFLEYWNQVTPENAGKHGLYETNRDRYKTNELNEIYAFARNNGLSFKQHTFLFWCCGAEPEWLTSLSNSEIRDELKEWIIYYFKTYPYSRFIEVVSEPFQSPPPAVVREAFGGDHEYAWMRWMYRQARKHAPPGTQLWINENHILTGGERIKSIKI